MYPWIWSHLPGGTAAKTALSVALALAVCALLFFVLFPWVDAHLAGDVATVSP